MKSITIKPEAEADIRRAYEWYEEQRPGLGNEFLEAVEHGFSRIRQFPEIAPVVYRNVRQTVLCRFPYLVLYILEENNLSVIGVFHVRRGPERWKGGV